MIEKYAIFGIGYVGKWFVLEIGIEKVGIIIDNNENLWGQKWNDILIVSLEQYLAMKQSREIVITAVKNIDSICAQLTEHGIENYFFYPEIWLRHKLKDFNRKEKTIFLMNVHSYTNGGDRFITYAEKFFLNQYFSDYQIILIPAFICGERSVCLQSYIRKEDILLISGGGYLGNLWMENGEQNVRRIIESFPENRIVIMPQTLYFTDDKDGETEKKRSVEIYKKNKNLIICLRDERSFALAGVLFGENRCEYIPDMTFCLSFSEKQNRKDVLVCFREDKESILTTAERRKILCSLDEWEVNCRQMKMEIPELVSEESVDTLILKKIEAVQSSRLVITDRLHCMMMCLVTGTPCIVFDNLSGKIKGTYALCGNNAHIKYVENGMQAMKWIKDFLSEDKRYQYNAEPVNDWFQKLKEVIAGEQN